MLPLLLFYLAQPVGCTCRSRGRRSRSPDRRRAAPHSSPRGKRARSRSADSDRAEKRKRPAASPEKPSRAERDSKTGAADRKREDKSAKEKEPKDAKAKDLKVASKDPQKRPLRGENAPPVGKDDKDRPDEVIPEGNGDEARIASGADGTEEALAAAKDLGNGPSNSQKASPDNIQDLPLPPPPSRHQKSPEPDKAEEAAEIKGEAKDSVKKEEKSKKEKKDKEAKKHKKEKKEKKKSKDKSKEPVELVAEPDEDSHKAEEKKE